MAAWKGLQVRDVQKPFYYYNMKAEKLTQIRTKGFLWLPERLGMSLLVVLTELI